MEVGSRTECAIHDVDLLTLMLETNNKGILQEIPCWYGAYVLEAQRNQDLQQIGTAILHGQGLVGADGWCMHEA